MTCVKEGGPGEVSAWLSGVVELVVSEVVVSEVVVREVVVSEVVASEVVASEVGPGCIVTMIADETLSDVVLSLPNVVFIMLLPSSVRAGHGRLLWLGNFKQVRVES
ncbi:unnamed protein product [Clonostachys rosea f. rosea IK726]|uniref:Uncharacterized protein n=1 Tax=Clonostachys rosea f. rosea IK726 TaxID=1349383 RepID=A0ACA9UTK1_BIOOC|nr:unnamed protein product [Clonostachys rosea f. rosea IK726]